MKKIVIMPGGFHPFHAGHMALYNAAREAFPSADVFVAATADTSTRPFPFRLKKALAQAAGVPGNRFIQVKSPFRAEEITQFYDPNDTQLIFVRSEKDRDQQPRPGGTRKDGTPAYLQPYKRNGLQPFSKHGYMAYLPVVQFGPGMTSATEIRAKWPDMTPEQKINLVKTLYPATANNEAAAGKIVEMLDSVMSGVKEDTTQEEPPQPTVAPGSVTAMSAGSVDDVDESLQGTALGVGALPQTTLHMPNGGERQRVGQRMGQEFDEAVLVNDPDAGHQIRPDGGMGTWDEESLRNNLARKFADMLQMVKNKNYKNLHYVLYKGGVVESMIRALAQYDAFMTKQGRRPIARGREIEMSDYLDEKTK